MTQSYRWLPLLAMLMAGCGQPDAQKAVHADEKSQPKEAPSKEALSKEALSKEASSKENRQTVFDDLTATKDQARQDTEAAVKQNTERTESAIDQAEGARER